MPDLDSAYTWAINTCNASNVGYSQKYRNQKTVNGITYYDCSSFINYALVAGGWSTPAYAPSNNAFTTSTMRAALLALGFTEYDTSASFNWLAGDIAWKSGHTEMCHTAGAQGAAIFMGAHTSGVALADQVSISTSPDSSFTKCYRYGDGGATGKGYSIYVCAALAGNAQQESSVNPARENGYMFQWAGERRTAFESWCDDNGYGYTDGNAQCEYLVLEGDWIQNYGDYATLDEFLNSASTDVEELTKCFCYCWERAGTPEIDKRIGYANDALVTIQNRANDTTVTGWIANTAAGLPQEDMDNNIIMLYRYFGIGGGGGGTVTTGAHMSLMFYLKPYYKRR